MNKRKAYIFATVAFTVFMLLLVGANALHQLLVLPNTGTTVEKPIELEASIDSVIIDSVAWGEVERGTTITKTLTLKNIGNTDTNPLSIAENLNEDATGVHIAWVYEGPISGTVLPAGETATLTLTLTVDSDALLSSWAFNIIVNEAD